LPDDRKRRCGAGGVLEPGATVAKTTGVNSTTVASRLSAAVTVLATAKTSARRAIGLPCEPRAIHAPAASKRP
jgi:hypothetical protein